MFDDILRDADAKDKKREEEKFSGGVISGVPGITHYVGGAGKPRDPEEITAEELAEYSDWEKRNFWKFASSMPFMPHWYVLYPNITDELDKMLFVKLCHDIFHKGKDVQVKKRVFRYLNIGDMRYWICDDDPSDPAKVILINRAYIKKWVTEEEKTNVKPVPKKAAPISGADWT